MINSQFFKDCGLILLNEEDVKFGIADECIWTFPGLENDWVVKSSLHRNAGMVISEFVVNDNVINTISLHPFIIEEPNDLNNLKNTIIQLNVEYKTTKEKLLLEAIRDDFH
jgi:hypothetical protein